MMRDRTPSKMAKTMSKTELLPLDDTEMSPEAGSASGRKYTFTIADAFPVPNERERKTDRQTEIMK